MKLFWPKKKPNYWIRTVTGDFGAGKTKNVFQDAFYRKQLNPDGIVIGNVPYDFVDVHYSSYEDLEKILEHVLLYIRKTNDVQTLWFYTFRPIYWIIDEAHTYFFSRNFKRFNTWGLLTMTQCRKRDMQMVFVTQTPAQIDILIRRLSPWVTEYVKAALWLVREELLYTKVLAANDLWDATKVDLEKSTIIWWDWLQKLFNPEIKTFFEQAPLSRFVIGLDDRYHMSFDEFMTMLTPDDSRDDERLKAILSWDKKNKKKDKLDLVVDQINDEQTETIEQQTEQTSSWSGFFSKKIQTWTNEPRDKLLTDSAISNIESVIAAQQSIRSRLPKL